MNLPKNWKQIAGINEEKEVSVSASVMSDAVHNINSNYVKGLFYDLIEGPLRDVNLSRQNLKDIAIALQNASTPA